jgi:COMPASS component SWD3
VYVSEKYPCPGVVYSGGGKEAWVIAGSENGKVVIWEMGSRRVIQVLEGHRNAVVALAVSSAVTRLMIGASGWENDSYRESGAGEGHQHMEK